MGISSTGSGRPFPLGPAPVPTRPPARGSPVLRALRMGNSEAALGRSAPLPARPRAGERCGTAYPSGGPGSYEASGRCAPLPRLPGGGPHFSREMGRKRAGPSVIGRWLRWNRCRVDPATWVPRRLRRGSPAFFGRKPEERTPGASPWTPGFMAARSHSLVFGIVVSDTIEGLFLSGF